MIAKRQHKEMAVPVGDDYFQKEPMEEASRFWERGLAHHVGNLPDSGGTIDELKNLLSNTIV